MQIMAKSERISCRARHTEPLATTFLHRKKAAARIGKSITFFPRCPVARLKFNMASIYG